ncbi:hypothetical protein NQ176_g11067 [Zarea fungicola]|uniref:Uncharacterized protein n=1 Tax=Zarea fungicola TaxID=93591 RepID=A0ACC1MCJ3_9HYPO|nr:hypothetical protein NQ176_g11067 [Lecanicillium fungicola]
MQAFDYGILYIVLSTFSELWILHYGQSVEISGLHYIVCSAAEIAGSQTGGHMLDSVYKRRRARQRSGLRATAHVPESRLPYMIPCLVVGWGGMLMYGWVAQARLHWTVVDVGVFIMLFGLQMGGMPTSAYLIDSYGEHVSSAMGATQFFRSLTAFLFPLFAPSMYRALGYGWANTIISVGGLIISISVAVLLWRFGAALRQRAGSSY